MITSDTRNVTSDGNVIKPSLGRRKIPVKHPRDLNELLLYETIYNIHRNENHTITEMIDTIARKLGVDEDTILHAIAWMFDFHCQRRNCNLRKYYTVLMEEAHK